MLKGILCLETQHLQRACVPGMNNSKNGQSDDEDFEIEGPPRLLTIAGKTITATSGFSVRDMLTSSTTKNLLKKQTHSQRFAP